MKTQLLGIAAMDPNRVIGKGLTIPWHYSEDFKFFKQTTLGSPIVMGRRTFESLGSKPLPKRLNVVISSTLDNDENILILENVKSLFNWIENRELAQRAFSISLEEPSKIFVIGGAQIYKELFPHLAGMYVTHIKKEYEGDVYMPDFEYLFTEKDVVLENDDFVVKFYEKINM